MLSEPIHQRRADGVAQARRSRVLKQVREFGPGPRVGVDPERFDKKALGELLVARLQLGEGVGQKLPAVKSAAGRKGLQRNIFRQDAGKNVERPPDVAGRPAGARQVQGLVAGVDAIAGQSLRLIMPVELHGAANIPFPIGGERQILAKQADPFEGFPAVDDRRQVQRVTRREPDQEIARHDAQAPVRNGAGDQVEPSRSLMFTYIQNATPTEADAVSIPFFIVM